MRTRPLILSGAGLGALLVLAAPIAASAHVSVSPDSAPAGASSVLDFTIGHGCEGSPTTSLTITVPEEIESVTPDVDSGWTIEKVNVPLADPIDDGHGNTVTERVGQVVFTAVVPLPDGYRDTVSMSVRPAESVAVGDTIVFPALQQCVEGQTDWSGAPGEEGEGVEPAPAVTITAPADDAAGGHGVTETETPVDAVAGEAGRPVATDGPDVVARVLGIAGLVVGVVGIVIALAVRRRPAAASAVNQSTSEPKASGTER